MMTLALVMMAGFWGCSDDDVESGGPFIEVAPSALSFENTGELTKSLAIKSNRDWTATFVEAGVDSWISIDKKSGNGDGTISVTVLANDKGERSATLKLVASTASVTIKITQGVGGGIPDGDALYQENMGTTVDQVDGKWPFVDQYSGWQKGGALTQTEVTYGGSGASVRNTGGKYAPADKTAFSDAPYIFMGSSGATFLINNINITGKTNFTLTFAALQQSDYVNGNPVFGAITDATCKLAVSLDGSQWSEQVFTSDGVAGWSKVKAEFKVPEGSTKLYVKVENGNFQTRYDDFKLFEGGNGELISPDVPPVVNGIFYEAFGSEAATKTYGDGATKYYPTLEQFVDKLTKGGTGAANVTYTGTNSSVRPSMPSTGYEGASGVNCGFFGAVPSNIQINDIALGGATKLTLSFGVSKANNAAFGAVATEDINVEVSNDGTVWKSVPYTISGTGWVLVTSEFAVKSTVTKLSLRFTVPSAASVVRVDDIKLVAGGNGAEIDFSGEPPVTAVPKTISEVLAAFADGQAVTEGWTITGTVVSDKDGKNINGTALTVVDASNKGIMIMLSGTNTFAAGDNVTINLTDGKYKDYNGLKEIEAVPAANVTKNSSGNAVTAVTITPNQMSDYVSMYVSINAAQAVSPTGNTMKGTQTFATELNGEFAVYTANGALFASDVLPTGNGTIKGIVGVYNGTYQLQPRNATDFSGMIGTRFGTLTFGTPEVSALIMKVGVALDGAKITLPYQNGKGEAYTINVTSSVLGITGTLTGNYNMGNGELEIPLIGIPALAGVVTFTISGATGLTPNTVEATIAASGALTETVIYETGFEAADGFVAGTVYNNKTEAASGAAGKQWQTVEGTPSTTSPLTDAQSMQMRWYQSIGFGGYTRTDFEMTDVTKVEFSANNTNGINVSVSYSEDGGTTWKGAQTINLTTSKATYTYTLNASGVSKAMIKFTQVYDGTPTDKSRLTIDDVKVYGLR